MSSVPRDPAIDSTLNVLREGYEFIWNRCRRFQTDLFETRIMGQRAVCIHGTEAAKLFYDESKFQRQKAIPRRVVTSLFGKNAVHTLDDEKHRHRKASFLALMTPASLARLMEETTREWRRCALDWTRRDSVLLFVETQRILTCAVCTWAGIPVSQSDQTRRSKDLASMVDAFGGVGPRLWRGKFARMRTEAWMRRMVQAARRGRVAVNGQSALAIMASHHGLDGRLLDARTAAVELINVIRPTVAISWYIAFAALALHEHPQCRERLLAETPGSSDYADLFMQEVRRFYPFAPFVGALVRRPFDWRGYRFEPGTLVLLDVYGTNHDPEVWSSPGEFKPERFRQWDGSAYNFIPQGGGDRMGHRCPGEWITMHNIVLALHFLTRALTYDIPDQDLTVDLSRMPTFPRSRLLLRNVRTTPMFHTQPPTLPSIIAAHDAASAESRGETGLEVYRTSGRHKRDAA